MSDHPAPAAASGGTAAARAADKPLRILIADDTPAIREILVRMLRQSVDAQVYEARNGPEALREYRARLPQVTFLDIDMPGADGLTVLKEIRSAEPQAFVVMVSAHGSLEKVQEAVALGVAGFVVKPFSSRRIAEMLRKFAQSVGNRGLVPAG
ncbi:MAG: response regulator [Burkholderiaceae bacterium]|nr:response regulator [Burkholderiaceae bacterium]